MATRIPLRQIAQRRRAATAAPAAGGRAAVLRAAATQAARAVRGGNAGTTAGYTFRGSGRSAAYRGAAGVALRGGADAANANRAGIRAEQAYGG